MMSSATMDLNMVYICKKLWIFSSILLIITPKHDIVLSQPLIKSYAFHSTSSFTFNFWISSENGFQCPIKEGKYKLICEAHFYHTINEIELCKYPDVKLYNEKFIIIFSVVAVETVILLFSLAYTCKIRKKVKTSYDEMELRKTELLQLQNSSHHHHQNSETAKMFLGGCRNEG